MKKIILIASLCAFAAAGIFANDSFTPAGSVSSYTKTTYNVTSKFGEYFRSVAVKDVHVFNSSGLETEVAYYYGKDELGDKVTFTYDVSRNLYLMGQICLPFTLLWFGLSGIAIFLEDGMRRLLFREPFPQYRWVV